MRMKTISFPFRFDGFGKVAITSDMSRIWADRVRAVISTYPGERLMRSGYGTALPDDLFGSVSAAPEFIDIQVANAFSEWLPDVTLKGVNFIGSGESDIEMQVNYSVPTQEIDSDSVYTITI
jgi:phage baseplate assembly protein W